MKRSISLSLSALATVLVLSSVGCHGKRLAKGVTPIPPERVATAPGPGPNPIATPTTPLNPPPSNPNLGPGGTTGPGPGTSGLNQPGDLTKTQNLPPETPSGIPTANPDLFEGMAMDTNTFQADTLYYDFDRSNVRPSEVSKVEAVASQLKEKADDKLLVDGHCDERGTDEYNRALGERRALSVREYLVRLGIDPERIRTRSWGKDRPADPGHDEAAWAKNRRAEFILLLPAPAPK